MWEIKEIIQMIKDLANMWRVMVSLQNSNTKEYRSIFVKFNHIPSETEILEQAQSVANSMNQPVSEE